MEADNHPALACLEPPPLRGWSWLQAKLVHHIKCAALTQLHASAAGELLLLRIYLIGEVATEQTLQRELIAEPPAWLKRQMDQHLAEEQHHAQAFSAALAERGAVDPGITPDAPDYLSGRKVTQWHRLAKRQAGKFSGGLLVPAFAIGLCAEQMATRVLQRHCGQIGPRHPFHSLLSMVLADEERHVRLCAHTLSRIVPPSEHAALAAMLLDIRAIERSFGVTGAIGMYLAGLGLRLRASLARIVA